MFFNLLIKLLLNILKSFLEGSRDMTRNRSDLQKVLSIANAIAVEAAEVGIYADEVFDPAVHAFKRKWSVDV